MILESRNMGLGTRWLVLGLIAICGTSLVFVGRAQAADCMTPDACYNAAVWQNAVAKDYFNQGVWFREQSKQYFGLAYEWNQKATFAFHAGDAVAATWYKAIADDYARKSRDNANAADKRFAQAAFTRAAAQGNVQRAFLLTAFFNPSPTAQQESADAQAPGDDLESGVFTAFADGKRCRDVKNKSWNFVGVKMEVKASDFCYVKPNHVLSAKVSGNNAVIGPQDLDIDAKGCDEEGTWYQWRSRGWDSGRKITVTCRWVLTPPVIKISVSEMVCKARLYLHSDGSAAYQKINDGDPTCTVSGPFG